MTWIPRDEHFTSDDLRPIEYVFDALSLVIFFTSNFSQALIKQSYLFIFQTTFGFFFLFFYCIDLFQIKIGLFWLFRIGSSLLSWGAIFLSLSIAMFNVLQDMRHPLIFLISLDLNENFIGTKCTCLVDHSKEIGWVFHKDAALSLQFLIVGCLQAANDAAEDRIIHHVAIKIHC